MLKSKGSCLQPDVNQAGSGKPTERSTGIHRRTGHIKPQRVGQEDISESLKDGFDLDYRLMEPRQLSQ